METSHPIAQAVDTVDELWGVALQPLGCSHCKQVFLAPKAYTSKVCPVCGFPELASQPVVLRREPPELLVPYQKKTQELYPILTQFQKGVWLRPDDFNADSMYRRLLPVFWPLWLVDSDITGTWQAESGFDYQVKSSQESYGSSGWRSRDVVETRIRWEPRLGQAQRHYDNVVSNAVSDHGSLQAMIGTCDLSKAIPYHPDLQSGSILRAPDLQPESAWPAAQYSLNKLTANDCQRACDAQHIRNFSIDAQYNQLHWTQLLLPMFFTFYTDDEGNPHPVFINGQTGKIGGVRLASQKKGWRMAGISLAIGAALLLIGLVCFALSMAVPPLSILGILLVILAFVAGVFAVVPAVWPWQWNRQQQDRKISSR